MHHHQFPERNVTGLYWAKGGSASVLQQVRVQAGEGKGQCRDAPPRSEHGGCGDRGGRDGHEAFEQARSGGLEGES